MRAEEIKDAESLQAWLESLPQETEEDRETACNWAVTIAHRAAMRALPRLWEWAISAASADQRPVMLRYLQHLLITTVVAAQYPKSRQRGYTLPVTPEIPKSGLNTRAPAAAQAILLCYQALQPKNRKEESSAKTVERAANALGPVMLAFGTVGFAQIKKTEIENKSAPQMFKAVSIDAQRLQGAMGDPDLLWASENPLENTWAATRPKILAQGKGWRFWVEWYENALFGRPQDYDLLTKIALIDPADWDKGADHVNALIQRIVAEHKPKPAPQPPEITDVERSHIDLVLSVRDPSRHSARALQKQFEQMESAYLCAVGSPNQTPPELEPIVLLSRTFGQIADLLQSEGDKDRMVAELQIKLQMLKANNTRLLETLKGEKSAMMRGIVIGALGNVAGVAIVQSVGFLMGPAAATILEPLWNFVKPDPSLAPPAGLANDPTIFET